MRKETPKAHKQSYVLSDRQVPVVRCECGAQIRLLPQVELMGKEIEAHAETHRKNEPDTAKAEALVTRIQDDLIRQALQKAASIPL
jgi:hypothetical protein